jgi:hypothetical protein
MRSTTQARMIARSGNMQMVPIKPVKVIPILADDEGGRVFV